jgi:hypothetical protein
MTAMIEPVASRHTAAGSNVGRPARKSVIEDNGFDGGAPMPGGG